MTPLRDLPHAAEVLAAGADLLDGLKLTWWLSSGTALGVVRDGRLIPHDTDLDVGVLAVPDVLARLDAAFPSAGFAPYRQMAYQRAYLCRDVIFDVWAYRREGEVIVADTDCGQLVKPWHLFAELERVEWSARSWPVPSPPEEYLAVRYGPNWRTPQTSKRPWQDDTTALRR